MMGEAETFRVRVVVLGGTGVGKSCLLRRFLFGTIPPKPRATVEDLYTRDFPLVCTLSAAENSSSSSSSNKLSVDFLDTSGEMQFPAMRRLSIATATAFLLVCSLDSSASLNPLRLCLQEIRELRSDTLPSIPIVVAINKCDLETGQKPDAGHGSVREVDIDDVHGLLVEEVSSARWRVIECSALEDTNVRSVFRALLELAQTAPTGSGSSGLRRRSSAHAARGITGSDNNGSAGGGGGNKRVWQQRVRPSSTSSPSSNRVCDSPPPMTPPPYVGLCPPSPSAASSTTFQLAPASSSSSSSLSAKPRSRSLIRRSSRKAKQQVRQAHAAAEDCAVS